MGHQDKLHTFVSKSTQANIARSNAGFSRFFIFRNTPRLPSYSTLRHHMATRDGISFVASWFQTLPARPFRELYFYARLLQVVQVS